MRRKNTGRHGLGEIARNGDRVARIVLAASDYYETDQHRGRDDRKPGRSVPSTIERSPHGPRLVAGELV